MTTAYILALLGGWLGFANPLYRLPLLVLALPAGLAYVAVYAPSTKHAAKAGYLIGAISACASLYWTALPLHDYGNMAWPLALPAPVLMGMVLGLYPLFLVLLLRLAARKLSPWLFGPFAFLAWTCMEMARGALLSGFPWLTLAAAFSPWPAFIQGAAFIGAYGLSGLLAGLVAWPVVCGPVSRQGLVAVTALAALCILGNSRAGEPAPRDGIIHATIVQGNVDQSRKWDPQSQLETVEKYISLSSQAIKDAPTELLIWPETTMPFYFQDHGPLAKRLIDFSASVDTPILFGAPAYERTPDGQALYNRAYLLTPTGEESYYDKEHLVPFGEYAPFGRYLPFLHKLVEGVGDFRPGHFENPLRYGRLALGTLICYEAIFPELAQQRVEAGANILVNISNDSWFGDSAAPRQHLDLALLRAVEQERTIIRGTNSGISAVIDPRGHITAQGGLFTTLTLSSPEAPLVSETTWYHRHYALIRWTPPCLLLLLCLAGIVAPERRSVSTGRGTTL